MRRRCLNICIVLLSSDWRQHLSSKVRLLPCVSPSVAATWAVMQRNELHFLSFQLGTFLCPKKLYQSASHQRKGGGSTGHE